VTHLQRSEPDRVRLTSDSEHLRNTAAYEQIREQINRRFSLAAKGTDWSTVARLCEQLASDDGMDLLIAIYYTVAATKTKGMPGLADGLEMQAAVLRHGENDLPAKRRAELYSWMLGLIGKDLRALKKEPATLRDLYRCDRAIQTLYTCLMAWQPEQMPDLEALGTTIFERIEQMEKTFGTTDTQAVQTAQPQRNMTLFVLLIGLLTTAGLWFAWDQYQANQPTLIKQITTVATTPNAFSQQQSTALKDTFGAQQIHDQQAYLIPLYAEKIKQQMRHSNTQALLTVQQLTNSLHYLYPDNPTVIALQQQVDNWHQQLTDTMTEQTHRFLLARTRAANIRLEAKHGNLEKLRTLTEGLEDYAISLSPLVGRIDYIDTLIHDGHLAEAKTEADILDTRINALLLKAGELRQRLDEENDLNKGNKIVEDIANTRETTRHSEKKP
jgi:type VI secretion system protein VasL